MKPLLLLVLLTLPFATIADKTTTETLVTPPQGWALNFNLGTASVDSKLQSQGLDTSAFSFGMSMDYLQQNWYSSILIEIVEFDDNYGFRQDVIGSGYANSGSSSTEKSSASSTSLAGAFGRAWFVNNNKAMFYAQGGFSLILDASRGIENCTNCHEEDLNVDGGLFTRFGATLFLDGFNLGAYSTYSLTGDITDSLGLTVGFQY